VVLLKNVRESASREDGFKKDGGRGQVVSLVVRSTCCTKCRYSVLHESLTRVANKTI